MRLQHYLIEDITTDDTIETIRDNCSQWLQESKGNAVYRGSDNIIKTYRLGYPRTDRRPRDSDQWIHDEMDNGLEAKYGWKPRSEGLFVTGDKSQASKYGYEYIVLPFNGYKYTWSPKIKDLFFALYSFSSPMLTGIDKFLSLFIKDEYYDEYVKQRGVANAIKTYKDTNLTKAIDSGNEIIIKCKAYYMMDTDIYKRVIGE